MTMPVTVTKKDGYEVRTPHGVKAKHTSKKNAESQKRLLNAIEHGWKPTGKKRTKKRGPYRNAKRKHKTLLTKGGKK